jgi:hypothetical protein
VNTPQCLDQATAVGALHSAQCEPPNKYAAGDLSNFIPDFSTEIVRAVEVFDASRLTE